ncbi:MAG TPA: hypothetical protein VLV76_21570 [Candidatus Acidoferrum sp.]|nr:hypothetical protein [Candidatus Acidoferrum sp.]
MDSLVPVILNGVVIVLLCAAIVFGIRLHRRLVALQSAQSEFAALLGRLDGALVQASSTVSALKYNAARQLEPSLPRPAAAPLAPARPTAATPLPAARPAAAPAPQPSATEPRHPAAIETIKTAPTKVEVAKPAPARRRRSAASLIAADRDEAADELMALMKKMRSAG